VRAHRPPKLQNKVANLPHSATQLASLATQLMNAVTQFAR
jgi:hypothetical protein